jgi:uncharacterized protein (DUF1800 family)
MDKSAFVRLATLTALSTFLCGAQVSPPPGMPASTAARILEQATWGPTAASIATLQKQGFERWFQSQVTAPISKYPNQPATVIVDGVTKTNADLTPVQRQFFQYALSNPDQLRQRVAFALSEIWVVSQVGVVRSAAYFPPLLNIFQKDAFGSYQKLMADVTLNPGMGAYLDMVNNFKATATSSPNENYGRELMQLFTLGLNNLNQDGTLALDQNNNPIPTYTPATVTAMSAALTGWTYAKTSTGANNYLVPMVPFEKNGGETQHDMTEKLIPFIGPDGQTNIVTLPAGQTAELDLDEALTAIYSQPSLAPFIVTQLIQHLVTSNPSPQYVLDVVNVFNATNGNLQQTVYAILTDPEARAGDKGVDYDVANYGHLREPILVMENLLRGLNGALSPTSTVYNYTSNLGQGFLEEPSVFSYFSPRYEVGEGLLAPEFQLHTTQTAVARANYIYQAIYNNMLDAGTTFSIGEFVTAAQSSTADLEAAISNRFFHGMMSSTLVSAINEALSDPKTNTPTLQAQSALYVALTSSEFQLIH